MTWPERTPRGSARRDTRLSSRDRLVPLRRPLALRLRHGRPARGPPGRPSGPCPSRWSPPRRPSRASAWRHPACGSRGRGRRASAGAPRPRPAPPPGPAPSGAGRSSRAAAGSTARRVDGRTAGPRVASPACSRSAVDEPEPAALGAGRSDRGRRVGRRRARLSTEATGPAALVRPAERDRPRVAVAVAAPSRSVRADLHRRSPPPRRRRRPATVARARQPARRLPRRSRWPPGSCRSAGRSRGSRPARPA